MNEETLRIYELRDSVISRLLSSPDLRPEVRKVLENDQKKMHDEIDRFGNACRIAFKPFIERAAGKKISLWK